MTSAPAGQCLPAADNRIDIGRVELQPVAAPAGALGGDHRRAAAEKGVQHDLTAGGAVEDRVGDHRHRLYRRVQRQQIAFLAAAGEGIGRVNAQLIDADTGAHLWAERFDGDTSDLFALQNEITGRIAVALNLELTAVEAARPAERPDALDYMLRGRAELLKPASRTTFAEAISLFEHALALDPRSVEAQSRLAAVLASRVLDIMTDSGKADIERAKELSEQALTASPRSPLAHYVKGQVLRGQRRYVEAIPDYETALASDRNWVTALFALGQCKLYAGSIDETIPLVERAIRLSPRDPSLAVWYWQIGLVHLLQSRTDNAIMWLEKARNANPELSYVHALLAAAYGLNGETERAAAELAEARRLSSEANWPSIAGMRRGIGSWGVPKIRALMEATYFTGLRMAGMPDE